MWPKPLVAITGEDIEYIVRNRASESRHLEFKRQPPNSSDKEMTRFLLSVAAFANAGGGYLIYGIDAESEGSEQGGVATELVPIIENVDALIRRLEDSMLARLHPRVYAGLRGVPVRVIQRRSVDDKDGDDTGNGFGDGDGYGNGMGDGSSNGSVFGYGLDEPVGQVLAIRIPSSIQTPHAVQTGDGFKFPIRVSAGRQQMDMHEVRRAISNSENASKRVEQFIRERYEYHRPSFERGSVILHVLPQTPNAYADVTRMLGEDQMSEFCPMRYDTGGTWSRFNLEGYVNFVSDANGKALASTQLFRDGTIEALSHLWTNQQYLADKTLVRDLRRVLIRYMSTLERVINPYPLVLSLALNVSKETRINTGTFGDPPHAGREDLILPHILVDERPAEWAVAIRPILDVLWNSFGQHRCPYFDSEGNWQEPRL